MTRQTIGRWSLAAAALMLAACNQQPEQKQSDNGGGSATATVATINCSAQTSHDWSAPGSQYYMVEAEAHGPSCKEAVATIRVRSRAGAVLYEKSYPVAEVPLAFNPNDDQTGMRSDLEGWATNAADTPSADWLPAWPAGADHPPFFRPAVTRQVYEGARGGQGPLFCYPDGAESNACIAMNGDHATLLGSRTPESE
ncbi:MAG: hypothetical protein QM759_18095 [Terricaulis sp.]